jgi:hypothetical protein
LLRTNHLMDAHPELDAVIRMPFSRAIRASRMRLRELLAPVYGWFTEGFDAPLEELAT